MKSCVLYERECIECGECNVCDLNPEKICDNCGLCIDVDSDYAEIEISSVEIDE